MLFRSNKTSLYSLAFGQHSLIVTPLQTAVALCSLSNGGKVLQPKIVNTIANIEPSFDPNTILYKKNIQYQNQYKHVGIYFPLFPEVENQWYSPFIKQIQPTTIKTIDLPSPVHHTLMESLHNVVNSSRGTARAGAIRSLFNSPKKRSMYKNIQPFMTLRTRFVWLNVFYICVDAGLPWLN